VIEMPLWMKFLFAFLWAAFCGLIAYLQQFAVKRSERPKWDRIEALIKSMTAGCAGFFTMLVTQKAGIDVFTAAFMVGIAGWGGAETFAFFKEIFQDGIRRAAGRMGDHKDSGDEEDRAAPR
jgi:uncharacterized membrane protein